MKNNLTIRLKRQTLCTALSACTLSPCLAQTARPLNLGQDGMITDPMLRLQTPRLSGYIRQRQYQTALDGQVFQTSERLRGRQTLGYIIIGKGGQQTLHTPTVHYYKGH